MSRRGVLLLIGAVVLVAGCAPDDSRPAQPASSSAGPAESVRSAYPPLDSSLPNTLKELKPFFAHDLSTVGVRLTRAAMVQLETGTHLQLYVQPDQASTPQEYLDRLVGLVRVTAPASFDRWAPLRSFDICQEPFGVESTQTTDPVSVVFLTRAQVAAVDWPQVTLADLRKVVRSLPGGEMTVSDEMKALPDWKAASPR